MIKHEVVPRAKEGWKKTKPKLEEARDKGRKAVSKDFGRETLDFLDRLFSGPYGLLRRPQRPENGCIPLNS